MNQLLQVFSRSEFGQAVKETKAERHARGFKSWDQFVAMLFCQLADAQSLREITGGLSSCEGRLEQLGTKVPKRSKLAYANEHRPWELFRNVFYKTAERCRAELGHKTKFRFKNRLLSIDSSVVTLCSKMFPWATYSRQKGAVKLHFTLDHAGYLPSAMVIASGKVSELAIARRQRWDAGTILLFDRGYIDFGWFHRLTRSAVWFITRVRADMQYEVIETRNIEHGGQSITDQQILICGRQRSKRYPGLLRVVTIRKVD